MHQRNLTIEKVVFQAIKFIKQSKYTFALKKENDPVELDEISFSKFPGSSPAASYVQR